MHSILLPPVSLGVQDIYFLIHTHSLAGGRGRAWQIWCSCGYKLYTTSLTPCPYTHTHTCIHAQSPIMRNIKGISRIIVEGQTWKWSEEILSVLTKTTLALHIPSSFLPRPFQPCSSTELDSPRWQPQKQPKRKLDAFIMVTAQQEKEGCGLSMEWTSLHHRQSQRLTVTYIAGFSKPNE